jgi:hypothetical protein
MWGVLIQEIFKMDNYRYEKGWLYVNYEFRCRVDASSEEEAIILFEKGCYHDVRFLKKQAK